MFNYRISPAAPLLNFQQTQKIMRPFISAVGYSNKLITRTLNISHRTIEKYFEKVYDKCNLNGRNDLIRALMQNQEPFH